MYKKRVTIKDIAEQVGVSTAAVSIVLSGRKDIHLAKETISTIENTARSLGYSPVEAKKRKDYKTIIYVYPPTFGGPKKTSFFPRVEKLLTELAWESGYTLLAFEYLDASPIRQLKMFYSLKPSVFVTHSMDFAQLLKNSDSGVQLILLQEGRISEGGYSSFICDDFGVGRLAADELIMQGYQKTAVIFPNRQKRYVQERLDGFFSRVGRHACDLYQLDDLSLDSAEKIVNDLASDRFDSYYFFNDTLAVPGMRALLKKGYQIPRDVGVIGTDNLFWARYIYPTLTTMNLHEKVFAERILEKILWYESQKVKNPQVPEQVRISVDLIRGESTGRLFDRPGDSG